MGVESQGYVPDALPTVNNTRTHWIEGWVGSSTALGNNEEQKIFCPHRISSPITSVSWQISCNMYNFYLNFK
jgi:hypothetical protein